MNRHKTTSTGEVIAVVGCRLELLRLETNEQRRDRHHGNAAEHAELQQVSVARTHVSLLVCMRFRIAE